MYGIARAVRRLCLKYFIVAGMFNYLKQNISQAANTAAEKIKTAVESVDTSQFNLDNLQKQMSNLEESMVSGIPDGSDPGDAMVHGLDITYVTPQLVAMGFPQKEGKTEGVEEEILSVKLQVC